MRANAAASCRLFPEKPGAGPAYEEAVEPLKELGTFDFWKEDIMGKPADKSSPVADVAGNDLGEDVLLAASASLNFFCKTSSPVCRS